MKKKQNVINLICLFSDNLCNNSSVKKLEKYNIVFFELIQIQIILSYNICNILFIILYINVNSAFFILINIKFIIDISSF